MPTTQMIFDTNCVLCSGFVYFILKNERDNDIVFINAWSEYGKSIAAKHGLTTDDLHNTYLVVEDGIGYVRSEAGMKIFGHLKTPWRWLLSLKFLPRPFRDWVYSTVAKNRYRWFGYEEQCFMPTEDMKHRFIDR